MSTNGRVTTDALIRRIEEVTGRQARKVGREYVCLCPKHESEGSNPSLNVREGDAGYPIIRCRSRGCGPEEVLAAVDLTWVDVFGDDSEHWTPNGPWVEVYDYTDEQGTLLHQVCRTGDKHFSQRQPDPDARSGWKWNLHGVRRVPYHLPQLIAGVAAGETAYICEGERDVQALEREGHVATTNAGGAGKWRSEFSAYVNGADVVIVADNDPAGYSHALQVYRSVSSEARSVRVVRAASGKDAADHLGAGFGVAEFRSLTVEELERSLGDRADPAPLPDQEPPPASQEPPPAADPVLRFMSGREFVQQPLAKIEPLFGEKGDALMMPGSLMLLAGIGGAGKTTLSLHMLAHFAAGLPWFGVQVARPIRCVVIENEGPHDPYVEKVKEFAERFVPDDKRAEEV